MRAVPPRPRDGLELPSGCAAVPGWRPEAGGSAATMAASEPAVTACPGRQERLRLAGRLRSAFTTPFFASQSLNAKSTCTAIGSPSRSLIARSAAITSVARMD